MNEITNAAPQIVGIMGKGGINPEQAEKVAQDLVGEYGWFVLAALGAILAKDMIMNFAQAIMVFMGSDFNNDDIIYISGRQARIVRVGIRTTCFYMTDRASKMVVPNEQLKQLTIEKKLMQNGKVPYLPTGGDPGYVGIEEVPIPPSPMKVKLEEGNDPLPQKTPKRPR
tara:strand:+ start:4188 stop:4694 length:507 start_codon:yes stop_codon:yes gene_type:complete